MTAKRRSTAVLAGLAGLAAATALALPVTADAAPRKFYGVVPQTALDGNDYSKLRQGRVGTLRIQLPWVGVHRGPGDCRPAPAVGVCDWRTIDSIVGNAASSGVRVLPFFYNVPPWVHNNPRKPPLKKPARRAWQDFLDAAVRRYGRNGAFWRSEFASGGYGGRPKPIKDWQVWNEPGSSAFFQPKPSARKYGKLLKHSWKAIHRADRKADVVLGGLFGDAKIPLPKFMRKLYKLKRAKRYFDAIAVHPYAAKPKGIARQLRQARRALKKGGDRKTRLWITEFGWASGGPKRLDNVTTKKGQAKMLKKSFRLLERKRRSWKIDGAIWFTWQDRRDRGVCRFCRHAGLFKPNDKAKPAWRAFKRVAR